MASTTAKRPRGRPKGSKNKKGNLSTATVRQICEFHRFNPAEKLIRIANNDDWDGDKRIPWPMALQARAAEKLFDAIHGKAALPAEGGIGESDGSQYEIVFVEGEAGFQLPGEGGAALIEGAMQPQPVQRTGVPSQDGQDSIRAELVDSDGADL